MSYSTTLTSTLTAPSSAPQYGKISPISVTEAMDFDQRPSASSDDRPLTDPTPAPSITQPSLPTDATASDASLISNTIQPVPVLDRPREGDGFVPQQPPTPPESQKGKTVPLALLSLSACMGIG
ncbi:MAG: hypothetical protein Q9163_003507 [Psora crenata]